MIDLIVIHLNIINIQCEHGIRLKWSANTYLKLLTKPKV